MNQLRYFLDYLHEYITTPKIPSIFRIQSRRRIIFQLFLKQTNFDQCPTLTSSKTSNELKAHFLELIKDHEQTEIPSIHELLSQLGNHTYTYVMLKFPRYSCMYIGRDGNREIKHSRLTGDSDHSHVICSGVLKRLQNKKRKQDGIDVSLKIILDNASGTFKPKADALSCVKEALSQTFPELMVETLDVQENKQEIKKIFGEDHPDYFGWR